MGLLDDAIREHLELKRRRGADPAEVERAEREALGPVRRQPEAAGELGGEGTAALEEDALPYDDEFDEDRDEEPFAEPGPHSPRVAEPPPGGGEHGLGEDEFASEPALREQDPERRAATPPPHPAQHLDRETEEYEVEFDDDAGPEHGQDDVLEETPEFLQDAPDHDRLWFEQRPPRDFNFDS